MQEAIISLLSNESTIALNSDSISQKLHIKNKKELQTTLNNLVSSGILYYSERKDKYLLFENSHMHKARLIINNQGNGIAKIDGKIITIYKKDLNGAKHNDLVAISLDNHFDNIGIVTSIIEKDNSNYVGEVIINNKQLYIYNKNLGLYKVPKNLEVVEGHRVLINHHNDKIDIIKVIGHKDEPGTDIKTILAKYDFDNEPTKEETKELAQIPLELSNEEINQELLKGRVDYRNEKIITIDGEDTKDIDDAVSIKLAPNGNIILKVFIADVAHYIKEDTALDCRAYQQATSVYPPGTVEPMFDHKISNGICSLNPNVDRFAMCYTTTFDSKGNVIDFNVEEAIINSNKKTTYSDINRILENNELVPGYEDYLSEIYLMNQLSKLITDKLASNHHLDFATSEAKVSLNETGLPTEIIKRTTGPAEKIIENFMISTNVELAKFTFFLGIPHIFRVHDEPNNDRLVAVMRMLINNNIISLKEKKKYNKKDLQNIIKSLKEKENAEIFYSLLIRCQAKAMYSDENIGHYALGATLYSHNTSPIRREPDLINQRIIKDFLHYGLNYVQKKYKDLEEKAYHCSERERAAEDVEREATRMKMAEYMESHLNEHYQGYISSVIESGFWVLLENGIEGFVSITKLPYDKYKYIEQNLSLIGHNHIFTIGDKIDIKVKGANKETSTIDFVVASTQLKNTQTQSSKTLKKVKK